MAGAEDEREATAGVPEIEVSRTSIFGVDGMAFVRTSDGLGWTDLHASVTQEEPHSGVHAGVPSLWLTMGLNETKVLRRIGRQEDSRTLARHAVTIAAPYSPMETVVGSEAQALHVFLRSGILREVAQEMFDHDRVEIGSPFGIEHGNIAALLGAVEQELRQPTPHSALRLSYVVRALATDVLGSFGSVRRKRVGPVAAGALTASQSQRVLDYIQSRLSADIALDDLAAAAGVSRTLFIQRFKSSFNTTPHQFVRLRRLEAARRLLADTNLPMKQIARACGFSDAAHFSAVFRQQVGVTASSFRRACQ